MNGKNYLLDTNAIIALLKGNQKILGTIQLSNWIGISIISQLEFLSYPRLSKSDIDLFHEFADRIHVVNLKRSQPELLKGILQIRKENMLKLPDAIIAATAIKNEAVLITADNDFKRVKGLELISFHPNE